MCLNHLPGPGCWVSWVRCDSPVSSVPCVSSGKLTSGCYLLADVNCPGSQEDVVSNWEPAHSLVEDASLWGYDWGSPLPSGSGCPTPASLPPAVGTGLYAAGQLSFGICSILCSVRGPGCELEPFVAKFSLSLSLFLSFSLAIPQFGLLSQVISFRLSSGHSGWGPYPKDQRCSPCLPIQTPLTGGGCEHLGYFSTGSCG